MWSPGNKSQLGRKAKREDGMITANKEKIKKSHQKCAARFKEVAQISMRVRTGLILSALYEAIPLHER